MDFETEYLDACQRVTDINEHLPVLSQLTEECKHVTELGVGPAQSTRAFLRHDVVLHSYEYRPMTGIPQFFEEAKKSGRNVSLHIADTRQVEIEETDLLFVDSLHIYEQVKEELRLHSSKAKKYIVFHDTTTFEFNGEFGGKGIWPAIQEFLDEHPEWKLKERRYNNNGLTVLQHV
jgi:cephalosporin hydroxylase